MTRFLVLISLLAACVPLMAQTRLIDLPTVNKSQRYSVSIDFRDANVTGICLLKQDETGDIKGTIVNEFGIHAMDFSVSADRSKVKLTDVISFMNKWYVKKVVKGDLKYLFSATTDMVGKENGKRKVEVQDDRSITLSNLKYKIVYNFGQLKSEQNEATE